MHPSYDSVRLLKNEHSFALNAHLWFFLLSYAWPHMFDEKHQDVIHLIMDYIDTSHGHLCIDLVRFYIEQLRDLV